MVKPDSLKPHAHFLSYPFSVLLSIILLQLLSHYNHSPLWLVLFTASIACYGFFTYKVIAKRGSDTSIGFGAKVKHFQDQPAGELIKNLEPEDLIKYGLIPEFVGRMPVLATLEDLDEHSLVKILKEPKNSLLKQYKRLFEFENVKLIFKDEAVLEIAKKAINKKTGARGLRSIIESLLLKTMFKLPAMNDVSEVNINGSAVKNNSEPIITHSKRKKTSAA